MSRRRKLLLVALVLGATGLYALWRAPSGARTSSRPRSRALFKRAVTVRRLGLRLATARARAARAARRRDHPRGAALPRDRLGARAPEPRALARRPHRAVARAARGPAAAHPRVPLAPARPGRRRHPEARRRRRRPRRARRRDRAAGDRGRRVPARPRARAARPRPARVQRPAARAAPRAARGPPLVRARPAAGGERPGAAGRHRDRRDRRTAGSSTCRARGCSPRTSTSPTRAASASPGRPQGQLSARGPGRPRGARAPRVPLRPRLRGRGALGGAALDRRLAAAHRGAHAGRRTARFMGVSVPRFASWLSYDGTSGLVMRDLDVETLGGTGAARDRRAAHRDAAPRLDPRAHAGGRRRGRAAHALRLGRARDRHGGDRRGRRELAARAGPAGSAGRIALDLAERADGRMPLAGRFDWQRRGRAPELRAAELDGPRPRRARERRGGRARSRAPRARGRDATTSPRPKTLLTRCRRALGNPEAQPAGFSGAGRFRGAGAARLDWPVFEGRFEGDEIGYPASTGARGVGRELRHRRRGGRVALARAAQGRRRDRVGRAHRDRLARRRGTRSRVALRATAWPRRGPRRASWSGTSASGRVTGERALRGRRSAPEGEAQGTARGGRYYGIAYDEARLESRWRARRAEVTRGAARLGGGRVGFAGSVSDDGVYDGSARDRGRRARRAAARARADGRSRRPRLRAAAAAGHARRARALAATLSSPRLFLGDEGIGALEARLRGDGDGRVHARRPLPLRPRRPGARGRVLAAPPYEADLALALRATSLDPFLRALQPRCRRGSALVASGEARIRPARAAGGARARRRRLPELELLLPDFPVRAREPVRAAARGGRLELGRLRLAARAPTSGRAARADSLGEGPLAIEARGPRRPARAGGAHAALARAGRRAARGVGLRHARGAARARHARPRGRRPARARLPARHRGPARPRALQRARGRARGRERDARRRRARRSRASSPTPGAGSAPTTSGPTGRGLALRYPEGLRSLLDAELRLFGDAEQQWITGTIDVRQAL